MSRRGGVVFSYILLLAEVLSSLLFTPFLIRSLGQAEFGVYSLVASVTAYFLLLDVGVGNALVRYLTKFRISEDLEQQARMLGLSTLYYSAVGVVILLLGFFMRGWLPAVFGGSLTLVELELAAVLIRITSANAAMSLVFSAFDQTLIAYERFVLFKVLAIAKLVLRVATLSALLYLGFRSEAVAAVNLLLTCVFGSTVVWIVVFRLNLRPMFSGMRGFPVKEMLGYSTFVFIQMAATQVNSMTDQVLLGIMTTSATVGVYAVGAQLIAYFQSIASSMNGILMPGVVRMVESKPAPEILLREMVKVGRLVFVLLGPIVVGFAICGQDFVALWVGSENGDAYYVALIMMVPLLFSLTQSIGGQILWAMGRHKIQALLKIGVALTNIALTVALIRWRPLIGASLGTSIAYLVGDIIVLNVVFSRAIGVSIRDYYSGLLKGIAPALALAGCVGAAIGLLGASGLWGLLLEGGSVLLTYVLAMSFFGLNQYERNLASSLLRFRAVTK